MRKSASAGDDACMWMHSEQAELLVNAFVVDIGPLKNGDFRQLGNPDVVDVDSLTFIVVQPALHLEQRLHKVVVIRSSQISEVNGNATKPKMLFSTKSGVLQVHRSSKKESDNEFVGLWNEHLDVVTRFNKLVLNREMRMRTKSDAIWMTQVDDVGDMRSFHNPHGIRHLVLFLPRDSPPLCYETPCVRMFQTCLHVVPHVSPLYNASGVVKGQSMLTGEILRRSIPAIACLEIAELALSCPGTTMYKHLQFSNSNTAMMHPGMRASYVSSFTYTPWKYWGQILDYMMDKPYCCTSTAFMLESMGVSDRSDIGCLDVVYGGDTVRIFGNDDPNDLCYTITDPDGSAVNLDQHLQLVSTGNVFNNDGAMQGMGLY